MASNNRGRVGFGRMFSPRRRSASPVASQESQQKRRQRRARQWRERFRRSAISSWQSSCIVQGVCDFFRSSSETGAVVAAATGSHVVGIGYGRQLRLESLEVAADAGRRYLGEQRLASITDNGTTGVVDAGDVVRNDNDSIAPGTITKTYGSDAFGVVTSGLATGSDAAYDTIQDAVTAVDLAGTVHVLDGSYSENVAINKQVSLLGVQQGVDARGRVASESIITGAGNAADAANWFNVIDH